MKLNIVTKINLLFAAGMLLLGAVLCVYFIRHERAALLGELDERGSALLNGLVSASEYWVLTGDKEKLAGIGGHLLAQKDVATCRITGASGEALFEGGRSGDSYPVREYSAPITTVKPRTAADETMLFLGGDAAREKIGHAVISLSLEGLHRLQYKTAAVIALVVALSVLVSAVAGFMLVKFVLGRPVSQLISGIGRFGKGELFHRVEVPTDEELGRLGRAFNEMADGLEERGRNLRESQQRFKDLTETTNDIVWETNAAQVFTYMSPRVKDLTGYPAALIVGKTIQETLGRPFSTRENQLVAELAARKDIKTPFNSLEHEVLTADGQVRIFEASGRPYVDAEGRFLGYRGTSRDITERKKAEEELKNYSAKLETTVKERTAQLECSNKDLEAFVYSVSHDLRGPVMRINGFAYMIEQEAVLKGESAGFLGRIRYNCSRMEGIINSLLTLSRSSHCEVNPTETDLAAMAADVAAKLCEAESGRDVKLLLPDGPVVACVDPAIFREVFENLIGNAWKFTKKTASPQVEFGAGQKDGRPLYYVKDNGAGFDMEYADKLFRPFQRLHSQEDFPGTGIGLNIVQRIIERHGGSIWAEGKKGEGAVFYFTLGSPGVKGTSEI